MAYFVAASFRINEGKEEEAVRLLRQWFDKIDASEKDTLVYSIYRSKRDPLEWLVYEKYRDEAASSFHNTPGQRGDFDKAAAEAAILDRSSFDMYEPVISIKEKSE